MLIGERLAKIQKVVSKQRSISMETSAGQVSVSKGAIRRDLTCLGKEGHLKRTHGGVILVQSEATTYDHVQRIMKHPEKKQATIQKVWVSIPKQASIFFDSSTTVEAAIRTMENSPIHVTMNFLNHALLLAQMDRTKIIILPGRLCK